MFNRTWKVSRGKFQNKMLTTRKNYKLYHGYKKQILSDEFLRRIFRRDRRFLSLIRYAMHDFHFPHLNLLTLSSIQSQAYIFFIQDIYYSNYKELIKKKLITKVQSTVITEGEEKGKVLHTCNYLHFTIIHIPAKKQLCNC